MDPHAAETVYRGNLDRIIAKIRDERGLDLAQYRTRYVERRLATRLNALGLHSYRQYAAYLDEHPEEYSKLIDTLTINVTQFFRDPTVFDVFRSQIVPQLLEEKRRRHQRMIRVWSAGCSTGQEAYSIAMSFLAGMGPDHGGFLLSVLGTDIDPKALEIARRAEYPLQQLAHIPAADRRRFIEEREDTFVIKPEVARLCKFQQLNLLTDSPIHVVDVVFCRNVFIYFNRQEQDRLLGVFWSALARGGYLVLGRSERIPPGTKPSFELVNGRERVYRKPYER
ncbi:MAG: protein-glutamate O-methyltransferase CheR [Coriobacteriia bacterium]|nr:protein-glutamate O-methyltransferase CheR [Coriobacteriia bacterium]